MELIPGVDSIGFLEHFDHGYPVEQLASNIFTIVKPADGAEAGHGEGAEQGLFGLIPYVRVLSTDLNFTVALALISVFMTQVYGVRSLGLPYFAKFINVGGVFNRPIFGIIDFGVGLLELISEISKILSFSFRLFGNIFAGSVLLFVIGTLIPVFAQSIFLLLEFFVGMIQAIVFGMLTMVFMSQAVAGHGDHGEESAH
jgi:F-type H+-transporting ATPase subunit a